MKLKRKKQLVSQSKHLSKRYAGLPRQVGDNGRSKYFPFLIIISSSFLPFNINLAKTTRRILSQNSITLLQKHARLPWKAEKGGLLISLLLIFLFLPKTQSGIVCNCKFSIKQVQNERPTGRGKRWRANRFSILV